MSPPVLWLSEQVPCDPSMDLPNRSVEFYNKFLFNGIEASVGDYVLISNADSANPDTVEGSEPAELIALYESHDPDLEDKYRARVRWYSRPQDLPQACFNKDYGSYNFGEKELIQDHRPFNSDVSIETFFHKCNISKELTSYNPSIEKFKKYRFICRYRLLPISKRKFSIEPVLEVERKRLEAISTPRSARNSPKPNTPSTLIKRMQRVSLNEKNWSVSSTDGMKLLLKKSVNDLKKMEKSRVVFKETLNDNEIREILAMDENADDEIPTLIIKRVSSKSHITDENFTKEHNNSKTRQTRRESIMEIDTPKKTPRARKSVNYKDTESPLTSPVKRQSPATDMKSSTRKSRKTNAYEDSENTPIMVTPRKRLLSPEQETNKTSKTTPRVNAKKVSAPSTPSQISLSDNDGFDTPTRKSVRGYKPNRLYSDDDFIMNLQTTPSKPLKPVPEESENPTRKSNRAKKPTCYLEESPTKMTPKKGRPSFSVHTPKSKTLKSKGTPRSVKKKLDSDSEEDFILDLKPKSLRTPKTPKTPRQSLVKGNFDSPLRNPADIIGDTAKMIKSLQGREQQVEEISAFVQDKLRARCSGCMYISGVPGTGKTATVCCVLQTLREDPRCPHFQLVEVNGMRLGEPRQAYVQIYKQLTGKLVSWHQAVMLLDKRFTSPGTKRMPTVLLVDELDALMNRRQDVLASIVEWSRHRSAQLTVLAVANTMDLPERSLAAKVTSRMGITRLSFPPYTYRQLEAIVAGRLRGAKLSADALQYIARKVAAVSGDARRALSLCERSIEKAQGARVEMVHVQRALDEATSNCVVRRIQDCSPAERLVLRALAAEVERTNCDETSLSRLISIANSLQALDGAPCKLLSSKVLDTSLALTVCSHLAYSRLIMMLPKAAEPRIVLNLSVDDVHYATRNG